MARYSNEPEQLDDCGHCTLLPTVTGWVRAVQVSCSRHSEHPSARRLRTEAERHGDGTTRREHDSDAWETLSGWLWSCRTCLSKGWADSEAGAQEKRAKHDASPVPWWVVRVGEAAK